MNRQTAPELLRSPIAAGGGVRLIARCAACGTELRFPVAPTGQLLEACDGCGAVRAVVRRHAAPADRTDQRSARGPTPVKRRPQSHGRYVFDPRPCATCAAAFVPSAANMQHCGAHRTANARRQWRRAHAGGA